MKQPTPLPEVENPTANPAVGASALDLMIDELTEQEVRLLAAVKKSEQLPNYKNDPAAFARYVQDLSESETHLSWKLEEVLKRYPNSGKKGEQLVPQAPLSDFDKFTSVRRAINILPLFDCTGPIPEGGLEPGQIHKHFPMYGHVKTDIYASMYLRGQISWDQYVAAKGLPTTADGEILYIDVEYDAQDTFQERAQKLLSSVGVYADPVQSNPEEWMEKNRERFVSQIEALEKTTAAIERAMDGPRPATLVVIDSLAMSEQARDYEYVDSMTKEIQKSTTLPDGTKVFEIKELEAGTVLLVDPKEDPRLMRRLIGTRATSDDLVVIVGSMEDINGVTRVSDLSRTQIVTGFDSSVTDHVIKLIGKMEDDAFCLRANSPPAWIQMNDRYLQKKHSKGGRGGKKRR